MLLEQELREFFGNEIKIVVIMGVGQSLRGDDAVGPRVIELLESKKMSDVILINAETVPENYVGKIAQYNPSHVLIVDAANFHGSPGETKLISKEEIGGQRISTHKLPLNISIHFIEDSTNASIIVLGIQPMSIGLGDPMTEPLEAAAVSVSNTLYQILSE